MKKSLIFIAVLFSSLIYAQGEYFSVSQPEEWSVSIHSQVERVGDSFVVLGLYQDSVGLGHYLQKYNSGGELEENLGLYYGDAVTFYSNAFKQENGNFYFSGYKWIDELYRPYGVKYNSLGQIVWVAELPEYESDSLQTALFTAVTKASSGTLFCGEKIYDVDKDVFPEYADIWVVKVDDEGSFLWESDIHLYFDKAVRINGIFELDNGDILLSGGVYTDWNQVLLRLDSEGNHLWTYEWGSEYNDWLPWVIQEENNEFVIAYQEGQSIINGSETEVVAKMRLMRYNANTQEVIWELEYEEDLDRLLIWDMIKTSDGGYAILGDIRDYDDFLQQIVVLKKVDSLGNELWHKEFVNPEYPERNSRLYDIEETTDCGFILAGETYAGEDTEQVQSSWLVKLDRCGEFEFNGCMPCTNDLEEVDFSLEELKVYPNPVNSAQSVLVEMPKSYSQNSTLSLRNALGQEVYHEKVNSKAVELNVSELSAGMYVITVLSAKGDRLMKRLVVE